MECALFRMLIQRYRDGELDPVERAGYERHRSACATCRALDRQFAGVFGALAEIPLFEPTADFNARVMARVDVGRYRARRARRTARAIENAWWRVPKPVRVVIPAGVAFAIFAAAYAPVLDFLAGVGERALALAGSSLFVLKELAGRSGPLFEYLSSASRYRVAMETLLRTLHRVVSDVPVAYVGVVAVALVYIFYLVVRAARTAWKKGDTNVGIF
jgi:hypothetical protein